jgi:ubiquinone/menaquinone biosynthesis C-methylase UbiE
VNVSVAAHLNIALDEYDARIRTFIPGYEDMLAAAARPLRVLAAPSPTIVDLGIGTGALAARCLGVVERGTLIGIDVDGAILDVARERLQHVGGDATFRQGSFVELPVPSCDAVVASLALHHVQDLSEKHALYRRIRVSLRPGGLLVTADCFPSTDAELARVEHAFWRAHLRQTSSDDETDGFFAGWAAEDRYVPLEQELAMLRDAGFAPEVVWRLAPMGVIAARCPNAAATRQA